MRVWWAHQDVALPFFAAGPAGTRLAGPVLGVMEMMTPARHQRRGAGRALLTHALAAEWHDDTELAVLVATPAGRRLYESIGFEASDEARTRFRGLEGDVLAAIGQPA